MSDQIGFTLRDGMDLAGVCLDELWWHYLAIGGVAPPSLLAEELAGTAPCGPIEHDLIAQALNETFLDRGINSFPVAYSDAQPRQEYDHVGTIPIERTDRSSQARRDAAAARLRSAAAARRAAALQLSAAALMQTSGQLQFARRARARARLAQHRGAA